MKLSVSSIGIVLAIELLIARADDSHVTAQEVYQLIAAGLSQPSVAIRQQASLVIRDAAGQESLYRREPQLDSNDGQWTGYYSRDVRQAIQWPQSNQGPMRIGTLDRSQQWQFRTSRMSIQPQQNGNASNTFLKPSTPILPAVQPLYRSVSQNVISNSPLPPAEVTLTNTHNETLILLIADQRNGGTTQKLRIPRGASERFTIERDSGATIVETFEVRSNYGDWDRREFRTPVPPAPIYDISVYEEFLQSIAIDRTGTSPNPIEDINYQPRSIGLFIVPPGSALPDRATLDPYRAAQAANNAGAVRRLNPKDYDQKLPTNDPLRDILREFQGRRAAF